MAGQGLYAFFDGYYRQQQHAANMDAQAQQLEIGQRRLREMDRAEADYAAGADVRGAQRGLQLQTAQQQTELGAAAQPGRLADASLGSARAAATRDATLPTLGEAAAAAADLQVRTLRTAQEAMSVREVETSIRKKVALEPQFRAAAELVQRWNGVKGALDHAMSTNDMANANRMGRDLGLEFRSIPRGPGEPPMVQSKPIGSPDTSWTEFTDLTSVPRYKATIDAFERRVQEQSRMQILQQDAATREAAVAARLKPVEAASAVPSVTTPAPLISTVPNITAAPPAAAPTEAPTASRLKAAKPARSDDAHQFMTIGAM